MFFHRNPAPEFLNVGFLNQGTGCIHPYIPRIYISIYIYIDIHTHICMYISCVYKYIYIYIYIYIERERERERERYTYIYIYIYIHMCYHIIESPGRGVRGPPFALGGVPRLW